MVPSANPVKVLVPTPAVMDREERYIGLALVSVYIPGATVIAVSLIVCVVNPVPVTKMVPETAFPEEGIAAEGGVVTYKMLPGAHANMVVTGLALDPIGDSAESVSVHPAALLPAEILVLLPFINMPTDRAGEPDVTLNILPEI